MMTVRKQTFVRVLGERNTGTRALIDMMRANPFVRLVPEGERGPGNQDRFHSLRHQIDTHVQNGWAGAFRDAVRDLEIAQACPTKLWKHGAPVWNEVFVQKRAHVLLCVRDPYSWVISLARNPYHKRGVLPRSLSEFIERPWLTVGRDNLAPIVDSPLGLWNGKNAAYLRFIRASQGRIPVRVLNFENFITDIEKEFSTVLADFHVPAGHVQSVPSSTKGDARTTEDMARYYGREEWQGWLTSGDVSLINARVDWDVANAFGYYRRDPRSFPARLSVSKRAEIYAAIGNLGRPRSKNWFRIRNLMSRSDFQ